MQQTGERSFFEKLPMWAKVLFLIFWPVSIPYFTYRMWRTQTWPTPVKAAITAVAAIFMITTLASGGPGTVAETSSSTATNSNSQSTSNPSATIDQKDEPESSKAVALASETETEVDSEPVVVTITATVVRIIDGDTIEVRFEDGTTDKVRLIGIDTPEDTTEKEPYGAEATAYTAASLSDKTVLLETDVEDRDRYDRLLAYVWLDTPTEISDSEIRQKLFNAALLTDGYAQLMTIQPNSKYVDYLKDYVAEARESNSGLWDPALVAEPAPAPVPQQAAPTPAPAPAPAPTPSASYSASRNSEVFHYSSCGHVNQIHAENLITFATRDAAVSSGRRPCKNCNP